MGIGENWETSESRSQLKRRCKDAGFRWHLVSSTSLLPLELAAVVNVQNLSKAVSGEKILTNLTFHLAAGDCLALLGANGSGKSLLLRILATLVKPSSGKVTIAEYDAFTNLDTVRPLIGYVPANFEGYPHLSVWEYLDFFAAAYKLERGGRSQAIQDVLDLMDVTVLRDRKIQYLSSGEKQRLCLAKTFLHDPLIWLLDEPLSALDARGQIEMRALIQELGTMGKTVVLATNRLADVMPTCNCVGILIDGHLAFYGSLENIDTTIDDLFWSVTNSETTEEETNKKNSEDS
ncbi:ABC transporter ATP-binding protein [Candidatus Poribacteria bacterium]|nr:ABC transporter ATP-binding protein [Candidatus Poribacteria bacterium]